MAGGTEIVPFTADETKMRYREPYLTAGLNEKAMPLAPGLYRGFKLGINGADLYVTVEQDPDPLLDDNLAVYRANNGFTMTIRRVGDIDLNLTPAAGSTVYIAIYAEYVWSADTIANIRMYTQTQWDLLSPAEKGEVLVLGKVVVPATGQIPAANISAAYRTLPVDTESSGERAWHNLIPYGDLRGIQDGASTQFAPTSMRQIPGMRMQDTTAYAAVMDVDLTDGVSTGSSFVMRWVQQDTTSMFHANIEIAHQPPRSTLRVKLRFYYQVTKAPTSAQGHHYLFNIVYLDETQSVQGETLLDFYPEGITPSSSIWHLMEVEAELSNPVSRTAELQIVSVWPGTGSTYSTTPDGNYLHFADIQLLVEDGGDEQFGLSRDGALPLLGGNIRYPTQNPPKANDPIFGGHPNGGWFGAPNWVASYWPAVGFITHTDTWPTVITDELFGFSAPWISVGEGISSTAAWSEVPRIRVWHNPSAEMTLALEPQKSSGASFSHVFMGSESEGNNFWFVTNALWNASTDEWDQQDAAEPSFAVRMPEYADSEPKMVFSYERDSTAAWDKDVWHGESYIGVVNADPARIEWRLQLGPSVRLQNEYAGSIYDAALLLGQVTGTPEIALRVAGIELTPSLDLGSGEAVLVGLSSAGPPKLVMQTDVVELTGTDVSTLVAPALKLRGGSVELSAALYPSGAAYLNLYGDAILSRGSPGATPVAVPPSLTLASPTEVDLRGKKGGGIGVAHGVYLDLDSGEVHLESEDATNSNAARLYLKGGDVDLRAAYGGASARLSLTGGSAPNVSLSGGAGLFEPTRIRLEGSTILYNTGGTAYLDLHHFKGASYNPVENARLYPDRIVFAWYAGYSTAGTLTTRGCFNIDHVQPTGIVPQTYGWQFNFRHAAETVEPMAILQSGSPINRLLIASVDDDYLQVAYYDSSGLQVARTGGDNNGWVVFIVMTGPTP